MSFDDYIQTQAKKDDKEIDVELINGEVMNIIMKPMSNMELLNIMIQSEKEIESMELSDTMTYKNVLYSIHLTGFILKHATQSPDFLKKENAKDIGEWFYDNVKDINEWNRLTQFVINKKNDGMVESPDFRG